MNLANKGATTNPFQFSLAWLLAWLTVMALVSAGVSYGRWQALQTYGTSQARAEWDSWRSDARKMAQGPGPVSRRPPSSPEPPALVLMRDHFAVCLSLALVLTTVLFGTFMVLVRGALSPGSRFVDRSPRRPPP
jgi:hypothetical protein